MKPAQRLTSIIEREDDGFVALCPELDVASQDASIEEARTIIGPPKAMLFLKLSGNSTDTSIT